MRLDEVKIEYIYDPAVDDDLDWDLRVLLGTCFKGPLFRNKRYNYELPPHRWYVRSPTGILAAHAAAHDKRLGTDSGDIRVGGVAEVCVHPDYRGQKLVPRLMTAMHAWMTEQGMDFSFLFGDPKVYSSSGYLLVPNPLRFFDSKLKEWVVRPESSAMIRPLNNKAWPAGTIDLRGPFF